MVGLCEGEELHHLSMVARTRRVFCVVCVGVSVCVRVGMCVCG